jgi:hypothetical protein
MGTRILTCQIPIPVAVPVTKKLDFLEFKLLSEFKLTFPLYLTIDICPACFCVGKDFARHKWGHNYCVVVSSYVSLVQVEKLPYSPSGTSFIPNILCGLGSR